MNRFSPLFLGLLLLVSCQSSKVIQPESTTPPEYTLIYLIHGDANYLYHNAEGYPLQADKQILQEAKSVAQKATKGEVFIFHQKPEEKILYLFPKKDRQFLYYRNGNLVVEKNYSPHSSKKSFVTETELYHQYHKATNSGSHKKVMLYFGHEIPHHSNNTYHYSRSDMPFDINIFTEGIQSFLTPNEEPFDLTVLSTCNNGTPAMVQALTSLTDYVLASPQNLHLSHIDTQPLKLLNESPQNTTITNKQLADSLATKTYNRLSSFLQTVVTLSVYDTGTTRRYLPSFSQAYEDYIDQQPATEVISDNVDCTTLPLFEMPAYTKGVNVWYKAPQFGHQGTAASYSGWGCQEK